MTQRIVLLSFCSLIAAGGCLAPIHATAADTKKDEEQIKADLDRECETFRNRDAVGAMAAYVKDDRLIQFDMFPPLDATHGTFGQTGTTAPIDTSKDSNLYDHGYQHAYQKVKEQVESTVGPIKCKISDFHVVVDNNHAYTRYILRVAGTLKDGNKPFSFIDRTTDVYEKIDGKWLIVLEHNSVPPT